MFQKLLLFRPTNDERRGQALVEFSLTVLVFIVLLLMIIELARIMYAYVNLQHSARAAARYAVTGQWMMEYTVPPTDTVNFHYKTTPPYTPQERIAPCWPLFNDDTVAPITPTTEPVEQSFQPYRDARTCSIERIALNNMVGLVLDPSADINESGYYRVLVSGVGKSVDPGATWERYEYDGSSWSGSPQTYTYQRPSGSLNIYQAPTTGFQLIAGYGGLPQQKVVVQIEYRQQIIAPILSSIAPNVRLTATAIMTNEAFGSTGLNREAVLPPDLPDLPEFLVPTPTDLVVSGIQGLPTALEEFQYGKTYDLQVVVDNQGDTAAIPDNDIHVSVYYTVGAGSRIDNPQNSDAASMTHFGTAGRQIAVIQGQPEEWTVSGNVPEAGPGETIYFYAMVDSDGIPPGNNGEVDETGPGGTTPENEDNNWLPPVEVTADIYADLTITGVDYGPTGKSPNPGQPMVITVEVTNYGPSASNGAQVEVSWDPAGLFGTVLPLTLADMNKDESATVIFYPVVSGSAHDEYDLTFTARAVNQKDPNDPVGGEGDTWTDTIAVAGVDLRLTQEFRIDGVLVPSGEVPVLNPGETMEVKLILENVGDNEADNVTVTHELPPTANLNVTTPSVSAGVWYPSTETWELPDPFQDGAIEELTYEVTLAAGTSTGITWVSKADAYTDSPTFNKSDDSVSSDARVASSDISVTMTTSLGTSPTPREDDQFTITITATNSGPDPATGVQISVPIHADLDYISHVPQTGTYTQGTGLWDIGDLDVGSQSLTITVDPVTGSGVNPPFNFIAELIAADQFDTDSTPNNGITTEDDYAYVTVDVGGRVDLAVNSYNYTVNGVGATEAYITDLVVYNLSVSTTSNSDNARNVEVDLTPNLPFDVVFGDINVTASQGTFDAATGVWSVGDMTPGSTETLQISARARAGSILTPISFDTTAIIDSAEIDPITYNNTLSADTLNIKPLFLNIGSRWSSNCNVPRTWNNVEWLPVANYGLGGTTYGLTGSDLWPTNGNDYGDMVDPGSGDGRRIAACRIEKWEDFGFQIDNLPEGQYFLNLLFVDMDHDVAGERLLDVTLSTGGAPTTILDDYDVADAAGGQYRAVTEQFTINITGILANLNLGIIYVEPPWQPNTLSGVGIEFDASTIPAPPPPPPGDTTPPTNPTSLTSPSHTVGSPSSDTTIDVAWSADATDDSSGVAGYSVEWDNSPATVPDTIVDHVEGIFGETSSALADGDWYFHLRTCDNAGNCAGAMHLGPFTIDTSIPSTAFGPGYYESNHPDVTYTGFWFPSGGGSGGTVEWTNQLGATASFTINGDQLIIYRATKSNYGPMEVCIDGSCQTISNTGPPTGTTTPVTFSGLGAGVHTVEITTLTTSWVGFDAFEVQ